MLMRVNRYQLLPNVRTDAKIWICNGPVNDQAAGNRQRDRAIRNIMPVFFTPYSRRPAGPTRKKLGVAGSSNSGLSVPLIR